MKRAFTLIELLIVIGIIGILAGVLMATFGGATESARAAKCLVNMRSLANAAMAYSMEPGPWYYNTQNDETKLGYFPAAGSFSGGQKGYSNFQEFVGWISWLSEGVFKSGGIAEARYGNSIPNCPYYGTGDVKKDRWALEHGGLWRAIGQTKEPYVCPTHAQKCAQAGRPMPVFSYVMNMSFGCEYNNGKAIQVPRPMDKLIEECRKRGKDHRADRLLMFAEIDIPKNPKDQKEPSQTCPPEDDCVLQYNISVQGKKVGDKWKGKTESMGFPHYGSDKRNFGHVAFADGHVEKIIMPKGSDSMLTKEQLTAALCEGMDLSWNGSDYKVIENEGDYY